MALQIVHYPHPTLRFESLPIKRVDRQLRMFADEMLELMYAHQGVGLAANQVDLPIRMFVMNTSGQRGEGEEWVLLNPVIGRPKGSEEDREGCLSLPGVSGNVQRPRQIRFHAFDLKGNEIDWTVDGFDARVLQHETDHLNGTMFFDRMSDDARHELEPLLEEFEIDFRVQQSAGKILPDETIARHRKQWMEQYG